MVNRVMILGSINVDSIYQVTRFPQPGETIAVKQKSYAPGGKGANQAVAAARSGAKVSFIGAVGADNDGQEMVKTLAENNVDTSRIAVDPDNGTGSAVITVDENGQNDIMVYGGANQATTVVQLDDLEQELAGTDFIVAQLETPQEVTLAAFKLARQQNVITILNPAPATELLPELLEYTDIIIPNETESSLLTGISVNDEPSMLQNAKFFKAHGVKDTIITLGEQGVFYVTADGHHGLVPAFKVNPVDTTLTGISVNDEPSMLQNAKFFKAHGVKDTIITLGEQGVFYVTADGHHGLVPAFKVNPVDTTAAGDTFIGALSSQLSPNLGNFESAITYAQRASSLAVQGMGAMPSIPLAEEVEKALG